VWSPSNRIAALLICTTWNADFGFVQVWDPLFHTIFKYPLQEGYYLSGSLVFASNHLLLCSGGVSNSSYWYHILDKRTIANELRHIDMPFCREVIQIILTYLPIVTHITRDTVNSVGPVAVLNSELVAVLCGESKLCIYKVHGNEPCLCATLPHKYIDAINCFASCAYPGKDGEFLLASKDFDQPGNAVVTVISPQV